MKGRSPTVGRESETGNADVAVVAAGHHHTPGFAGRSLAGRSLADRSLAEGEIDAVVVVGDSVEVVPVESHSLAGEEDQEVDPKVVVEEALAGVASHQDRSPDLEMPYFFLFGGRE